VLEEHYYGGMVADTSHLLMSVSKSLIAMVEGALAGDGLLDTEAQLTTYVPAVASSR
jgi:CubicO group peptidase (beta-lactamase class C family)